MKKLSRQLYQRNYVCIVSSVMREIMQMWADQIVLKSDLAQSLCTFQSNKEIIQDVGAGTVKALV